MRDQDYGVGSGAWPRTDADTFFEYLDDAVIVVRWDPRATTDPGFEIEYLNAPAELVTGWLSERTIGRWIPVAEIETLLDGLFTRLFEEARLSPRIAFEHQFEFQGSHCWTKVSGSRVGSRMTVVLADTTDQKANDRCLARLHEITADSDLSSDEKIARILALGAERFTAPIAVISQIHDGTYTVVQATAPNGEVTPGQTFDLKETYCAHVMQTGAPVGFHHVGNSEIRDHACYRKFGLETYIGTPLSADDQWRGTLSFSGHTPRFRPVSAGELELARLFAIWIGQEIRLARKTADLRAEREARQQTEQRLQQVATTDELTNVCNRHHFLELSEREFRRARRHHRPLAVIMLDTDHFKIINESYGHHVGDQVLRELSRACRDLLRENDVVGRIGGEEFAITLPETTDTAAQCVAERVRKSFADIEIPLDMGSLRFTVSMGISRLEQGDVDFSSLMKRADQALHESKTSGRNCLTVYGKSDPPTVALRFGDRNIHDRRTDRPIIRRSG